MQLSKHDALIVVDVQNDFCEGGALAVPGADDDYVLGLNLIVGQFVNAGATIVFTQDYHTLGQVSFASNYEDKKPFETIELDYGTQVLWPDHCVIGTEGVEFHPSIDTRLANLIIRKGFNDNVDSYSAFYENDKMTPTGLSGYLFERGIDRVFIIGLAYDFCVGYSAIDGSNEYGIYVIEDACRAINLNGSLDAMNEHFSNYCVERIQSTELQ